MGARVVAHVVLWKLRQLPLYQARRMVCCVIQVIAASVDTPEVHLAWIRCVHSKCYFNVMLRSACDGSGGSQRFYWACECA